MSSASGTLPPAHLGFAPGAGIAIRYAAWPSAGCPVVFVHGTSDGWQTWLPALPYLYPALSPIALDLRGHGDSDKPEREYSLALYAEDVWNVVRELRLPRPPVLVGHSLGGAVVRYVAIGHADELAAVVMEDSALYERGTMTSDESAAYGRKRLETYRLPHAELVAWLRDVAPGIPRVEVEHLARRIAGSADGVFLAGPHSTAPPEGETFEELLPRVTCPALQIQADPAHGGAMRDVDVTRQVSLFPRLSVARIPHVGHQTHLERPERFAAALLGFLRFSGVLG